MTASDIQKQIDAISWYHEFDFPGGFSAKATTPDAGFHRKLWKFIEDELNKINFAGKTVLDIGCWDGYWSFYAERRGAAHVLATDDASQNWAGSKGLALAKTLLNSRIETRLDVSIYDLTPIKDRFDIILCLGVYYHLVDPFYAFAQVRHLCHPDTIVVFEGDITGGLRTNTSHIHITEDHSLPVFVPSFENLDMMLKAVYFSPQSQKLFWDMGKWRLRDRLKVYAEIVSGQHARLPTRTNRAFTICTPFRGVNKMHAYKPPFGLHRYDDRFSSA